MSEIFTRRKLPHWYVPGAAHFVTFRLAGSLPRTFIHEMKECKEQLLKQRETRLSEASHRERVHKRLFAWYDEQLDGSGTNCLLADPRLASLVRGSLHFLHGTIYELLAHTVMPNHVHVLFIPYDIAPRSEEQGLRIEQIGEVPDKRSPLSKIMHSLKSYTAHKANRLLDRHGQFWQHESYDHWVRDEIELDRIVDYINGNAVKAALAEKCHEYFWCSAHDRFLSDGDMSGWMPAGPATREGD